MGKPQVSPPDYTDVEAPSTPMDQQCAEVLTSPCHSRFKPQVSPPDYTDLEAPSTPMNQQCAEVPTSPCHSRLKPQVSPHKDVEAPSTPTTAPTTPDAVPNILPPEPPSSHTEHGGDDQLPESPPFPATEEGTESGKPEIFDTASQRGEEELTHIQARILVRDGDSVGTQFVDSDFNIKLKSYHPLGYIKKIVTKKLKVGKGIIVLRPAHGPEDILEEPEHHTSLGDMFELEWQD